MSNVWIDTVTKLLVDVRRACVQFHNDRVVHLSCKRVQADEISFFVYAKEKIYLMEWKILPTTFWTCTAIEADSRQIFSYAVGRRHMETAQTFMQNVALRI